MILEMLDAPGGRVVGRTRVADAPLTIGRALDNDVILDDPYLDPHHARIVRDADGRLALEDLGSTNGLLVGGAGERQAVVHAVGGVEVQLGRTTLRFRDPAEALPPALVLRPDRPLALAGGPARARGLVVLAALALVAAGSWVHSQARSPLDDVATLLAGVVIIGLGWAGLWALAGRVVVHRFEFSSHLAVFAAAAIAAMVAGFVGEWTSFFFPENLPSLVLGFVVLFALCAAVLAGHLALASRLGRAALVRSALVITAVTFAVVGGLAMIGGGEFTDVPEFAGVTKPLDARWVPTMSVEEFVEDADDLREEVDELVVDGG